MIGPHYTSSVISGLVGSPGSFGEYPVMVFCCLGTWLALKTVGTKQATMTAALTINPANTLTLCLDIKP